MMKKLVLVFLLSHVLVYGQKKNDSLALKDKSFINTDSTVISGKFDLFTDDDLRKIDSLLLEEKFSSFLVDTLAYVIDDKDLIGEVPNVLTTELLKSRLKVLNERTPFNLEYNPALEKVINSYLLHRRKYYPAFMARAEYYFPMFEQYLDQFDIPLEMKYLAIVESALSHEQDLVWGRQGYGNSCMPQGNNLI